MVEISFGLIRRNNPELDFDALDSLTNIDLNDCGITEIDNLDLFTHISELHLSRNNIQLIANLDFFSKLEYLDLSHNKIDAASLRKSFTSIPASLKALNLTGNDCAADTDVCCDLQDLYPDIGIVIDNISDDEAGDGEDEDGEEEEDEEEDEEEQEDINALPVLTGKLNSDEILKALVERKCRLQNVQSSFSLDSAKSVRRMREMR
jgi:Ran GTPase-activating protein (RanGAP) involved in mRNA processing and transport